MVKRGLSEEEKRELADSIGAVPFDMEAFEREHNLASADIRTDLDEYGQLREDSTAGDGVLARGNNGDKYLVEHGKSYLVIQGPKKDRTYKIEVSSDAARIPRIVSQYMEYLGKKGKLDLDNTNFRERIENGELYIVEGKFPFKEVDGKHTWWAAVNLNMTDAYNKPVVIVALDSSLRPEEKIQYAYHELVHSTGIDDEHKTQLETIQGLREMVKDYPHLMQHEEEWLDNFDSGYDPDQLAGEDYSKTSYLRKAANYAISAGRDPYFGPKDSGKGVQGQDIRQRLRKERKPGKLEKIVGNIFLLIFGMFAVYITGRVSYTGFFVALDEQTNIITSFSFLFIIALVGLSYFFVWKYKKINDII